MSPLITAANVCYRDAECLVRGQKQHNINKSPRVLWRLAQFPRGFGQVAAIKTTKR